MAEPEGLGLVNAGWVSDLPFIGRSSMPLASLFSHPFHCTGSQTWHPDLLGKSGVCIQSAGSDLTGPRRGQAGFVQFSHN